MRTLLRHMTGRCHMVYGTRKCSQKQKVTIPVSLTQLSRPNIAFLTQIPSTSSQRYLSCRCFFLPFVSSLTASAKQRDFMPSLFVAHT
ncbi:hypothetical protein L596_012645 [Steinernema carpocapsae]|uniref:Uncharacterized protein n=1 Tax=Steinernema carpocapsae TaxID=34508 RepID=A0A4U5NY06_STECR|nr:hypothetical protein L596_012645 [Steinernema carpocapsae]